MYNFHKVDKGIDLIFFVHLSKYGGCNLSQKWYNASSLTLNFHEILWNAHHSEMQHYLEFKVINSVSLPAIDFLGQFLDMLLCISSKVYILYYIYMSMFSMNFEGCIITVLVWMERGGGDIFVLLQLVLCIFRWLQPRRFQYSTRSITWTVMVDQW